jgi:uncharacterized protein (TIGR02001 family)
MRAIGALSAVLAAAFAFGASGAAQAAEVTGNATLTTDYVWRGSTQTQGDPAVQAGVKVAGESGFYGSVWGSNVEFAPETHASSEFDFIVGWGRSFNDDWALDVNVLHYRYPSTAVDLDWTELNGSLTWKGNYWVSLGWSNEALGLDESGLYGLLGARFPINDRFRFEAALAYYDLAEIYFKTDNKAQALPWYQKLVDEFTQSEYLEKTQERLKELNAK